MTVPIVAFSIRIGKFIHPQDGKALNADGHDRVLWAYTRVQRLLKDGVIQIIARGNPLKLGFNLAGNLKIRVDSGNKKHGIVAEHER